VMCDEAENDDYALEYPDPVIISKKTKHAAALVRRVYEFNCMGGNLHCQLDDYNLEDEFWDIFTIYINDASPDQISAERKCFNAFKAMSIAERASALHLARYRTEKRR